MGSKGFPMAAHCLFPSEGGSGALVAQVGGLRGLIKSGSESLLKKDHLGKQSIVRA